MLQFRYTAVLDSGEAVAGQIQCPDRAAAIRRVIEMGYHPVSVDSEVETKSAGAQLGRWYERIAHRIGTRQLAIFTRQLASLLKAGLTLIHALKTLSRQCENRRLTQIITEIESTISRDAAGFAEALERHPDVFSPVYRGLVRAGENGGTLAETLADLATHLAQAAKLRGQVMGAFIYPIFLLILGTAAIFVLLSFVIPKFQVLFTSLGQQLPLPTRILVTVSGFFEHWWPAVLVAIVAGVVAVVMLLRREEQRKAFDRRVLRLPVLGGMVLRLEIARVSRSLAALMGSGVPILLALEITADTARNTLIQQSFHDIRESVSTGQTLAEAFEKTGVYPPLVLNLIGTGEDTGELPQMLDELASIYQEEADRAVEGAVKLLEPLLIVFMGLIIAGIVAAVILPIFQANVVAS